jgi:hypothetical protein
MWSTVLGVVVGLIGWALIVTLLNFGLRAGIPGYHAAEPTLQFTLAMEIGRLSIAALTSLAAGALVNHLSFLVPLMPVAVLGAAAFGPDAETRGMEMTGGSRSGS